jgi:diguanylate cyclase (GGDEF)-like protein
MSPHESEDTLSGLDQGFAEADQSAADLDQTLTDADQTSSDHDQTSADHDQEAADIDRDAGARGETAAAATYERTRRMRAESAEQRDVTNRSRIHTAIARDEIARQRDQLSAARDIASAARDRIAESLDDEIARLEENERAGDGDRGQAQLRAAQERRLAGRLRVQAAAQRKAAAEDRVHAANDRRLAALDRLSYAKELARADIDEVTGALRRRVGLTALQREMERTLRTGEPLLVVFIDVDGLKHVNDTLSHAAGDELLRAVVRCVGAEFRSYDLILRFGGDEFVCSITGDGLAGIGRRFERIAEALRKEVAGAQISVGIAERLAEDTVGSLIDRADAEMISLRRNKRTRCETE